MHLSIPGLKLGLIAEAIDARLVGDPEVLVFGIAPLDTAGAMELSFLNNPYYRPALASTKALAVILSEADAALSKTQLLIAKDPRVAMAKAAHLFMRPASIAGGIDPSAYIGLDCHIAASACVGPQCVVGDRTVIEEGVVVGAGSVIGTDCRIGSYSTLKSRVTLYDRIHIGSHTLIHSGAVIGSDGFGFANDQGQWLKIPHFGGVRVGNRVEIGANTTIDRGVFDDTVIGNNVIIDNLVQIAHNVHIGSGTAMAACVAIGGSTMIGEYCLIGGGASIAGHLQIADKVHITGTSAVNHSLHSAGVYASGLPAKPVAQWRRNVARFQYLDEMAKRLKILEKQMLKVLGSGDNR
jgi:UDP-3-O-[3-hydroxymyristoyl] glucosamine N-acyltransferase